MLKELKNVKNDNYKKLRRIEDIYEVPPWEHIESYIISENKKLNDNTEFLEYYYCVEQFVHPLCVIFEKSLRLEELPQWWSKSLVVPL